MPEKLPYSAFSQNPCLPPTDLQAPPSPTKDGSACWGFPPLLLSLRRLIGPVLLPSTHAVGTIVVVGGRGEVHGCAAGQQGYCGPLGGIFSIVCVGNM